MALGRIRYVDDIRTIWVNEVKEFTPWLARNIEVLGEELGLDIEMVGTEQAVGAFSLDILAKDLGSGALIAIENQLEATDHSHLGQLLTYASGLDAKIVIWVAKEIREEHRKAIDWLNQITSDDAQFFAVEVQVITIDDSSPAPLFKIKASPNEWSKAQKERAGNGAGAAEKSSKQQYYHDFFTSLLQQLHSAHPTFTNSKKVGYDSWYGFGVGKTGFAIQLLFVAETGSHVSCT